MTQTRASLLSLAVVLAGLAVAEGAAKAQDACTIRTTPLAFGIYDVFSPTDLVSTATVTYNCYRHGPLRVTVDLSKGAFAATNSQRQMSNGSDRLSYNLYLDSAHTQVWGDPSPYHYATQNPPNKGDVTLTVYAVIPAGQDVAAGVYFDTVATTINF
jgi:spore coat protein U-like protein